MVFRVCTLGVFSICWEGVLIQAGSVCNGIDAMTIDRAVETVDDLIRSVALAAIALADQFLQIFIDIVSCPIPQ
jgi:hypothetical protein